MVVLNKVQQTLNIFLSSRTKYIHTIHSGSIYGRVTTSKEERTCAYDEITEVKNESRERGEEA
jgi:effector-binding domain-containing protein